MSLLASTACDSRLDASIRLVTSLSVLVNVTLGLYRSINLNVYSVKMSIAALSPPGEVEEMKMDIDHHDMKQALTPPTSESTGKKDDDEDSGSELSELEPEESVEEPAPAPKIKEEEDEEIVPDHYYEGGKIPVFKPVSTQGSNGISVILWGTTY